MKKLSTGKTLLAEVAIAGLLSGGLTAQLSRDDHGQEWHEVKLARKHTTHGSLTVEKACIFHDRSSKDVVDQLWAETCHH
jgi:hypothetical protein